MNCDRVRHLLLAYLDNEVADADGKNIKAHIEGCLRCRQEADTLIQMQKQLRTTLNTLTEGSSQPEETWARISQRITSEGLTSQALPSIGKSGKDFMFIEPVRRIRMFLFGRSKWRLAAIGSALVALVIALSLILPSSGGHDKALAEEIARNSEAFKIALDGERDVRLEKVVEQGNRATVTFITTEGKRVTFEVDTSAEAVVETDKWIGFDLFALPDTMDDPAQRAQAQEAIGVAETDSRVQEFLAAGGFPQGVLLPSNGFGNMPEGGNAARVFFLPGDIEGQSIINGNYRVEGLFAWVDLDTGQLLRVEGWETFVPIVQLEYALSETERQEAMDIATADPKVQDLLAQGFVVADVSNKSPAGSDRTAQVTLMPEANRRCAPVGSYEIEVNLSQKQVSDVRAQVMLSVPVVVVQVSVGPTEDDIQEAIRIAKANPEVQDLLAQGYTISEVYHWPQAPRVIEVIFDVPESAHERIIEPEGRYVLYDYVGMVRVDLNKKEVLPIRKGMTGGSSTIAEPTELSDADVAQAKEIAAADPRVQELIALGCAIEDVEHTAYWGPRVGVVYLSVPESQWYHIRYALNYAMYHDWDADGNNILRIIVVTDLDKNEVSQLANGRPWNYGANGTYTWTASESGKNAIRVETPTVVLTAADFYTEADGVKYLGQVDHVLVQGGINLDPTGYSYGALNWSWFEREREMRLIINLKSDGAYWWADEIRTYDGQPHWEEGWIRYSGEFFKTEIEKPFTGNVDLVSAPDNEFQGRIHFEGLVIQPLRAQ
ncbi:MAG: zf-HC2 domain-containing protein [Dehalococcoidia bacterium]|nr:zf-HC2 domain-containing protein [Dehalococcoidia bacterium]